MYASEGRDQTVGYVEVESFDGIDLDKSEIPKERRHYAYLAPEDASPPAADAFVQVSWEWMASVLQSFLAESYDEFPARTTAQLKDFIDMEMESGERRRWTFRQGKSDWSWMFPREWCRKLDEDRPVADSIKPNARIGFLHRLERNKEEAVRDHTLVVYVRNAPSGHKDFYDGFTDRFTDAESEIDAATEGTNLSITGNKSNVLRGEYEIEVDRHDDFFDAYLAALARAVGEGVVSNQELIETIDRLYEATITEDISL